MNVLEKIDSKQREIGTGKYKKPTWFFRKRRALKQWTEVSKFFCSFLVLIIGITGTICFYEGKLLNRDYNGAMIIVNEHQTWKDLQAKQAEASTITAERELTIDEKIEKAFGKDAKIMLAIAKAESHLNREAINVNNNKTIDVGIFQINSVHNYSLEFLLDVDNNIQVAKEIFEKQGFEGWASYNNDSFKKYLR